MLFALIFVCNRISQIVTLTPIVGMLGWFVNKFNDHNALTPDPVLILFIVSTLALAWAVFTLFSYHRSSHNALLVALVDILFVGAFIAGIYYLSGIRHADCDDPSPRRYWTRHVPGVNDAGIVWGLEKPCAMLKASWAFAIINCMLFAVTAFAAYLHGDKMPVVVYDERVVRSSHSGHHSSRHSHRHRSRSGGSRHSHRSHRVYV
ncbi:hypothetical protein PT974_06440 [Cladobotryum mycophilum]|uniref:MARVEL domain-containing protein n=1 Tax=Cladobotryum mycophilum TaxID=491253 RepID=A0ABR0SLL9_9HYPO